MKTASTKEALYWDAVAGAWGKSCPQALWREHSDAVNLDLLARWLPQRQVKRLLKTDVFDEAFGEGLYELLASKAESMVAVDISLSNLGLAQSRHSGLRTVGVDVRELPFADHSFDVIVSNSTLDHFPSHEDIVVSLRELCRVLKPGGQLLLTMDNLANPIIALRDALPFRLLHRLRLVPYYVGATYGPRRLRRLLQCIGFDVVEVTAVMHCPRVLAVPMAAMVTKYAGGETRRRFLRACASFERLSGWPTRFLTGHFVAVRAAKS